MKLPPIILGSLILVSVACAAVIPVQPIKVQGTAMLPALNDGDRIVIEPTLYEGKPVKVVGDIHYNFVVK